MHTFRYVLIVVLLSIGGLLIATNSSKTGKATTSKIRLETQSGTQDSIDSNQNLPARPPHRCLSDDVRHKTPSSPPQRQLRGGLDQGGETCFDATVIPALPYWDTGTTVGFINDYDYSDGFSCPEPSTSPDVVYQYTPVANETVDVSLCDSDYDTKLIVYEDICENTFIYNCDDDGCPGLTWRSLISGLELYSGHTYFFVVDGFAGDMGNYWINIDFALPPPPNDDCVDAIEISCPVNDMFVDLAGATLDCHGIVRFPEVWYTFYLDPAVSDSWNVAVSYCDTDPNILLIGTNLQNDCTCDDYFGSTSASEDYCTSPPAVPEWFYYDAVPAGQWWMPIYTDQRTYVIFDLICEPCPFGSIQLSTDSLEFSPTHAGELASLQVTVTNVSESSNLAVYDITTTGHIWDVDTTDFVLAPLDEQVVTVTFEPTFDHDFYGTIEFFSSDTLQPRDSLYVSGTGCETVIMPLAPHLFPAASPTDIYFAMPWDDNEQSVQYAIEFSSNGFVTSEFVQFPFGTGPETVFFTAGWWGHQGTGIIPGLEPDTQYEVRLRVRDCTGDELVGPSAFMSTLPEIVVEPSELTIQLVAPGTIEFRWDPEVTDTAGNPLPNYGYIVYFGAEPDIIDSVLGFSTSGSLRVDISAEQKGFFYADPIVEGVTDQPCPFISWPPDGATISGSNSVVIQDLAHQMQWDSFRVEIDSAGVPALIGSSYKNPWHYSGINAASTDFNRFEPGPHTITATIVDLQDRSWSSSVGVTLVPEPYATFDCQYNASTSIFTIDTMDVQNIGGGLSDILWPTTQVGERYGGTTTFEWKTTMDSLTVLMPVLQLMDKVYTETVEWSCCEDGGGGVVPEELFCKAEHVKCFCEKMELRTSGKAKGKYGKQKQKGIPLGPDTLYGSAFGLVGFSFEVEYTLKYLAADEDAPCYYGQDAKGDRITTQGRCSGPPNHSFTPTTKPDTSHKEYPEGGREFPRDSANFGNDDYRPDDHGTTLDGSTPGKVRTLDTPRSLRVFRRSKRAYRLQCRDQFFARCDPNLPPDPPECCLQWDIEWDVIFCGHGKMKVNQPPTVSNVITPSPCPSLAPN